MNSEYENPQPVRPRRLRYNPAVRRLVEEYRVVPQRLIQPLFVCEGVGVKAEISSMPGVYQMSLDVLCDEVKTLQNLNLGGIILFGIPAEKDEEGSDALSDEGIIARAVREAKAAAPNLLCLTDVCFCEYTSHGHCGALAQIGGRIEVDNDTTLEMLAKQALVHARAGADMLAPSGMMDGMVGAMRDALDDNGFQHLPILSYAVKYASAFYGPFRDAAESSPQFGDRRSYQMQPSAIAESAIREAELDLMEGADMIMVKPALAYLDIIRLMREHFPEVPLAAYNVSGEYSMVKAAALRGWLDEKATVLESLIAIQRAGAGIIITYWAKKVAQEWLP
ncbi:MAG: porphobilinogen synthase [Planctomycetia bacterium]|nr:porphobilinogen synthase [Planctomycetia bacterium]